MLHTETVEPKTLDLLKELMGLEGLQSFSLVGGTNLSLQFGHRISVDLDFFSNERFDPDYLFLQLKSHYPDIKYPHGNDHMLFIYINEVKIDCVYLPYSYIKDHSKKDGITLGSIPDIIAMELHAISNRGAKKDFYDIVELLKHYNIEEMIQFYKMKYEGGNVYHVIRTLSYFGDADREPGNPHSLNGMTREKAKKIVKAAMKDYIEKHY